MWVIDEIIALANKVGCEPDTMIFVGWFVSLLLISFLAELWGMALMALVRWIRCIKKDR